MVVVLQPQLRGRLRDDGCAWGRGLEECGRRREHGRGERDGVAVVLGAFGCADDELEGAGHVRHHGHHDEEAHDCCMLIFMEVRGREMTHGRRR